MNIPIDALSAENQNMDIADWLTNPSLIKKEIFNSECVDNLLSAMLLENDEPVVNTEIENTSSDLKDHCSYEETPPDDSVALEQSDVKIPASEFFDSTVSPSEEFYTGQPAQPTYSQPKVSINSSRYLPDFQQTMYFYNQTQVPVDSKFTPIEEVYPSRNFSVIHPNASTSAATLTHQQLGNTQDFLHYHPNQQLTSFQSDVQPGLQMQSSQTTGTDAITMHQVFVKEEHHTGENSPESKYFHQPTEYIQVTKLPRGTIYFTVSRAQICLYEDSYCAIQHWRFYSSQNQTSEKISSDANTLTAGVIEEKPQRCFKRRRLLKLEEINQLQQAFAESQYPSRKTRERLASALNLTNERVRSWFEYQRAKLRRREKSARMQVTENKENLCTLNQPNISDIWLPIKTEYTQVYAGPSHHVDHSRNGSV